MNLSDQPMRYLMLAAHASPDIVEYPDKGEFAADAKSLSQRGEPVSPDWSASLYRNASLSA